MAKKTNNKEPVNEKYFVTSSRKEIEKLQELGVRPLDIKKIIVTDDLGRVTRKMNVTFSVSPERAVELLAVNEKTEEIKDEKGG